MEPVKATTAWTAFEEFGLWARISNGTLEFAPMIVGGSRDDDAIHEAEVVERSLREALRKAWPGETWAYVPVVEDDEV